MIIVAGLGNPGDEYKKNRHNAGRIIIQMLADKHDFYDWKEDIKNKALISSGKIESTKMQFILPNNFMNNSGKSVGQFVKSKKDLASLVVIYDDIDLPIGRIKISFNRSSGGHNGLESVIKSLHSKEFVRIRVGISPHTPGGKLRRPIGEKAVLAFLLKDFKDPEMKELKKMAKTIALALETFAQSGKEKMMTEFN